MFAAILIRKQHCYNDMLIVCNRCFNESNKYVTNNGVYLCLSCYQQLKKETTINTNQFETMPDSGSDSDADCAFMVSSIIIIPASRAD
jgi:hypothetical protein